MGEKYTSSRRQSGKPWYKRWWGIITVILIWPLFFGWVVWRKTMWPTAAKVCLSVVLAGGCFLMAGAYTGIIAAATGNTPSSPPATHHSSASPQPPTPAPTITTKLITEKTAIDFTTTTKNDSTLPKGQTKVITPGKDGVSTSVYKVTYTNGIETDRELESETTTTRPVDEVDAVGTYVAPLLDVSGSGIQQTRKFTASGDYSITYTFDCSNFGYQGNFQLMIYNDDGSLDNLGANDLAMSGGNTDYYYDAGTHYLEINSECSWHVTVKG